MRRSLLVRRSPLVVLAAAVVALAGCGVPDSGPAVAYGRPSPATPGPGDTAEVFRPRSAAEAKTPEELVQNYLRAATGTADMIRLQIKDFLAETAQSTWQPSRQIGVLGDVSITALGAPAGQRASASVRLTATRLGTLDPTSGVVDTSAPATPVSYVFDLAGAPNSDGGTKWAIRNPPDELWLSTGGLRDGYAERAVYFPSAADPGVLVPDLRYVPRGVTGRDRYKLLVDWLLHGPSKWLAQGVQSAVPDGTEQRGVPTGSPDNVIVDLSAKADVPEGLDDIAAQLAWTLAADTTGGLQVQIEGHDKQIDGTTVVPRGRYTTRNPATLLRGSREYVVVDGRVRAANEGVVVPALIASRDESQIQSAATRFESVALVTAGPAGRGSVLQLARSRDSGAPNWVSVPLGGPATSQPAWISGDVPRVLVGAGGALLAVPVDGQYPSRVADLPGSGDVTSVSVAPDSLRVAWVRAGQAYIGQLDLGTTGVSVTSVRPIAGALRDATTIAWNSEDTLAVGGVGPDPTTGNVHPGVWQVTVDGALFDAMGGYPLAHEPVGMTAAVTSPPSEPLVEADGRVIQPGRFNIPGTAPFLSE